MRVTPCTASQHRTACCNAAQHVATGGGWVRPRKHRTTHRRVAAARSLCRLAPPAACTHARRKPVPALTSASCQPRHDRRAQVYSTMPSHAVDVHLMPHPRVGSFELYFCLPDGGNGRPDPNHRPGFPSLAWRRVRPSLLRPKPDPVPAQMWAIHRSWPERSCALVGQRWCCSFPRRRRGGSRGPARSRLRCARCF